MRDGAFARAARPHDAQYLAWVYLQAIYGEDLPVVIRLGDVLQLVDGLHPFTSKHSVAQELPLGRAVPLKAHHGEIGYE